MPILTNYELQQYRIMAAFATRLWDLLEETQDGSDFMLAQKRFDIAEEMGIKLPIEEES